MKMETIAPIVHTFNLMLTIVLFEMNKVEAYESTFTLTAKWFSSPMASDVIRTESARSPLHCWLTCRSTLGCTQVEYTPGDSSCKIIRDISDERPPLVSGASKQWHLTDPSEFERFSSDKVISAGSQNSIATYDHVLESWTFTKRDSDTALRVQWFGSGGADVLLANAETYFVFRFNGLECSSPCAMDFEIISGFQIEFYWPFVMEGQCQNLPAGPTTLDLVAKTAIASRTQSTSSTARLYQSHILITEVNVGLETSIVQPNVQGYQYATNCTFYSPASAIDQHLDSVSFQKQRSDTVLLVTYTLNLRTVLDGTCTRWYVSFDGSECSSPGKIEAPYWIHGTGNVHFVGVIGGVCENIPPGRVVIDVKIDACRSHTIGQHASDFYQKRFFLVEEINPHQTVPDFSSLSFHTSYHYWTGEDFIKNGTINASVTTYNKVLTSSVLRVRYFGTLGSYGLTPGTYGSIWCFHVDGIQCSNPDEMCFEHWTAATFNNGHRRPFHLVGICRGLPRKKYTISLVVRPYPGLALSPVVATGFSQSSSNFLVIDELFTKDA